MAEVWMDIYHTLMENRFTTKKKRYVLRYTDLRGEKIMMTIIIILQETKIIIK